MFNIRETFPGYFDITRFVIDGEMILPSLVQYLDSIHVSLEPNLIMEKVGTMMTPSMDPVSIHEENQSFNGAIADNISIALHALRRNLLRDLHQDQLKRIVMQIEYEQDGWDFRFVLCVYFAGEDVQ